MEHIGDVVCAIIEQAGKFLITQRPASHQLAGKWEFPGGKIINGESAIEALEREIQEELNLKIKIHTPLTPIDHSYSNFSLTLIPYRCTITRGTPQLTEHEQLAWVTDDSVTNYELSEADVPILEEYLLLRKIN